MRPLVLASAILLVLSGCAAPEPESQPVATAQSQSTQTTEPVETTEPTQEAESTETAEATEPDATNEPEPGETEVQSERIEESESESTTTPEATSEPEPIETPTETTTPTTTPTPTEEPAPEPEAVGYTLAEVAQKNSAAECWVAIDGGVYDLTLWISSHPGGQGAITQLCGTDGTAQFLGMHGGQSRPSSTLDGYLIGPLR